MEQAAASGSCKVAGAAKAAGEKRQGEAKAKYM